MNSASNESIARTTDATILLVVLILLIVYRSPMLALIPLSTIGLSVFIGLKAIACMSLVPWINFQVINITNVFVVVVLFGAGTDYCLFLIARYREELARGRTPDQRPDRSRSARSAAHSSPARARSWSAWECSTSPASPRSSTQGRPSRCRWPSR